jgi:alkylation response protein AidB-like acyl-CoA dehydrogenase
MDFELSDDQATLHAEALALAKQFSLDYWLERDAKSEYPWDFIRAFADHGWLETMIPEQYGGAGLGITEAALLLHAICRSGAGTSGASAIHFYMFPPAPIIRFGSEEMKQKYLPRMAKGEIVMAFGITEPNAGSDLSRITTKATRTGDDGWTISGQKVWTTNAQNADKILLIARTSERNDERPLDGLTLFFTDLDREKCEIRRIEKLGRAAIDSNEVFIDGLEATDADIVGEVGQGFKALLDGLNPERIVIAMEAIGIGRAALELATEYARTRVVFGRPIGQNQAVAHPLAEAWAELEAAELMSLKAAARFDAGLSCGKEANAAKNLAAEASFRACDAALQTFGGFGYAKEYHVERLWREVRLYRLAPVSNQLILNYIAQHVLDLPRSY